MDRKWLEQFYKECGREVTLAYNVVNQANNWGITIAAAVVTAGFLDSIKVINNKVEYTYPTLLHWYLVIIAWVVMVRFFVRSALALTNMYRWNAIINSIMKVLSLPENDNRASVYMHNCAKKIEKYYIQWKSPISKKDIIWINLKLMYLWFFIVILVLFGWGIISLKRDLYYWLGLVVFVIPTSLECLWFYRTGHFKHEKPDSLKDEDNIVSKWLEKEPSVIIDESKTLVFGFCKDGPYKQSEALLTNSKVMWIPWSYHESYISSDLLHDLSCGMSISDRKVVFAGWPLGTKGDVTSIRNGRVDYVHFANGILRVTVNLDDIDPDLKRQKISVKDSKILCFYLK